MQEIDEFVSVCILIRLAGHIHSKTNSNNCNALRENNKTTSEISYIDCIFKYT